jgi:hypothetical protein
MTTLYYDPVLDAHDRVSAAVDTSFEPTWDISTGEFTWGIGLDETLRLTIDPLEPNPNAWTEFRIVGVESRTWGALALRGSRPRCGATQLSCGFRLLPVTLNSPRAVTDISSAHMAYRNPRLGFLHRDRPSR